MGCGPSLSPEQKDADKLSTSITKDIVKDFENKKSIRILLLGCGDSGKSTFSKQLQIINGMTNTTMLKSFIPVLRDNCICGAKDVVAYMKESRDLPEDITEIITDIEETEDLTEDLAKKIIIFSEHKNVVEYINSQSGDKFQGGVLGIKYYFKNALKFSAKDFVPDHNDMLMARRKTVGVHETNFELNGNKFTIVDVGGQRSERKKIGYLVLMMFRP